MRIMCVHMDDNSISIYVPPELAAEFKLMVSKGTNCSPNQSHYIRDFHDRLRNQEHIMGMNMKDDIFKAMKEQVAIITTPTKEIERVIETTKQSLKHDDECDCDMCIQSKVSKPSTCRGHPETCNCAYHCR